MDDLLQLSGNKKKGSDMGAKKRATVLVVDDSAFMRRVLSDAVLRSGRFRLAGTAINGLDSVEKVRLLDPDLTTMDIETDIFIGDYTGETLGDSPHFENGFR